jgi:hypothetical protein
MVDAWDRKPWRLRWRDGEVGIPEMSIDGGSILYRYYVRLLLRYQYMSLFIGILSDSPDCAGITES